LISLAFLVLLSTVASAVTVDYVETWRSPFGTLWRTAVDPADNSLWVTAGRSVMHLSPEGNVLSQTNGLVRPRAVAVDASDGSCWVGVDGTSASDAAIVHLAEDGTELLRLTGLTGPFSLSVNSTDDSLWVVAGEGLLHFSGAGTELSRTAGYSGVVAANPTDGSVWVNEGSDLVHLNAGGGTLGRGVGLAAASLAVSPPTGGCYAMVGPVTESFLVHLAADGTELWRNDNLGSNRPVPCDICALEISSLQLVSSVAADGSCWVLARAGTSATGYSAVAIRLSDAGEELARFECDASGGGTGGPGDYWFYAVTSGAADGSCWLVSLCNDTGSWSMSPRVWELVRLTGAGTEAYRGGPYGYLGPISLNTADGSVWLNGPAGVAHPVLTHLSETGAVLWEGPDLGSLPGSVVSGDGSVWASMRAPDQSVTGPVHLSATGVVLGEATLGVSEDVMVSVNPQDGTCWVGDGTTGEVVHLAPDGSELWRGSAFTTLPRVAVNPTDGSCWAWATDRDTSTWQLVHLAADGTELWRSAVGEGSLLWLVVNPSDGSCWLFTTVPLYSLVHLSADGTELCRTTQYQQNGFVPVSVNPVDGSVWGFYRDAVFHLAADGTELWRSPSGGCWCGAVLSPADGSVWTRHRDGGTLQWSVVQLASDGHELWRSEEGYDVWPWLANPSDGSVWGGNGENRQVVRLTPRYAIFSDVLWDHWAFAQVEACYRAGIVAGYDDGLYRPTDPVTRDQMAVYIARALAGGDGNVPNFAGTPTFSDVPSGFWALKHVEYAVGQGVVGGYDDDTYRPTVTVDRGQMAVFVARALVAPGGDAAVPDPVSGPTFSDVATDFWAYKQVEYCVGQGVVNGYDDGTYRPGDPVTRDQMAVYVARAFQLPM
jgi:hypothetical protein